ncbi:DUF59 domain-containing protein [bacterium]|nr:DUF59 domain-containing protein [bacterium]
MEKEKIEKIIKEIEHPEINRTLFQLGMIGDIKVENKDVFIELKLPFLGVPIKNYLIGSIEMAVKKEFQETNVKVEVVEMTPEERMKFMEMAQIYWKR